MHEEISVLKRRPSIEVGADWADHGQLLPQGCARVRQHVGPDLASALVLGSRPALIDRETTDGRRRIRRVVAIAIPSRSRRRQATEFFTGMKEPSLAFSCWWPVRKVNPPAIPHHE